MRGLARLDPSALRRLGGSARPGLADRPAVGIVHLGIGAFHRAHQAVYTAEAIERAGGDWGILGVAQRRPAAVDALVPQDGLFSVVDRGPEEDVVTVYSPVRDVLLAPREPGRLTEALADPGIHVVTLTVTERATRATAPPAACGRRTRGRLRPRRRRAAHAGRPARARHRAAGDPRRGGAADRRLVRQPAAQRRGARQARARLLRPHGRRGRRARLARSPRELPEHDGRPRRPRHHGRRPRRGGPPDRARGPGAVVAEPFRQWVIEDAFAGPRPAWEQAGALIVPDAGPHEAVKLRLLNGTHSMLAYVGGLAGARTVAGAWGDPDVAAAGERLGERGPRADAARGAGHRHRRLPRRTRPPLDQPADPAPARADRRRRLAEAAGALRRPDPRAAGRRRAAALGRARHGRVGAPPAGAGGRAAGRDPGAKPVQGALAPAGEHREEARRCSRSWGRRSPARSR